MSASLSLDELAARWSGRWPEALSLWSRYTKLSAPILCENAQREKAEGLTGSFAMIRLVDKAVVVGLTQVAGLGLEDYALEVLAHEIGHHVLCPADLTDQGRMLARMRGALLSLSDRAPLLANLYADLLINDRLLRSSELRMADIYTRVGKGSRDRLWTLYMRIYEILWRLPRGSLATAGSEGELEGDAQLGARLVRVYGRDWMAGAGGFAMLCLPYLQQDGGVEIARILSGWRDLEHCGAGGDPAGLTDVEDGEEEAVHPSLDPNLGGDEGDTVSDGADPRPVGSAPETEGRTPRQARQPYAYGELLRALGLSLDDHEAAVRYYRERAAPYLIPYPARETPQSREPHPEGLAVWDAGEPLESLDVVATAATSPVVIPGVTTRQRLEGLAPGGEPKREPVDLDLYVDCSGSMPNPQRNLSYLTLAGAIIGLSAIRANAKVQATLWSGKNQFQSTRGFTTDAREILRILTGYLGGATQFPIHVLRDTFASRKPGDARVHIMVISDDGVTTMLTPDETGANGLDITRMALEKGGAGGSLVLNGLEQLVRMPGLVAMREAGWTLYRVQSWADLVDFARRFSRATYGRQRAP